MLKMWEFVVLHVSFFNNAFTVLIFPFIHYNYYILTVMVCSYVCSLELGIIL